MEALLTADKASSSTPPPSPSSRFSAGAEDRLAVFDIVDDAESQAFPVGLLASGTVPREKDDFLFQTGNQSPVTPHRPEATRARKKDKTRIRKHNERERHDHGLPGPGTDACVSPYFDKAPSPPPEIQSDGHVWDEIKSESDPEQKLTPRRTTQTAAFCTNTRRTVPSKDAGLANVPSTASSPSAGAVIKPRVSPTKTPRTPKHSPGRRRETTSCFFTPPSASAADDSDGQISPATASDKDEDRPAPSPTPTPRRASRRGIVSGLPVPPLDAPHFGLVQEQLATDPFWLLVALVFLTRVVGRVSLPVFWAIKARYPTPQDLVDADPHDLVEAMRHLGMASVRCAALQRYARRWLAQPPRPGVCTTVKNYPLPAEAEAEAETEADGAATSVPTVSQWEIGHITQGAYAIDSWRIFCRDRLLGRSTDWKGDVDGKDNDDSFQPEWMRVLPRDKELRACLRWMWMREGWDWDPWTGDRMVLQESVRRAVNEGRVGYNAKGQLQIVKGEDEL